jgi:two-component system, cell cycle sensor histidine kinase and response regulator CckA
MAQLRIVLADDDQQIRSFLRGILRSKGFDVREAVDGQEAVEVLKELAGVVDLLITDIKMPRLDGVGLAKVAAEMYPALPVLFISGWTFDLLDDPQWRQAAYAFLRKPFLPNALISSIERLLARSVMKAAMPA